MTEDEDIMEQHVACMIDQEMAFHISRVEQNVLATYEDFRYNLFQSDYNRESLVALPLWIRKMLDTMAEQAIIDDESMHGYGCLVVHDRIMGRKVPSYFKDLLDQASGPDCFHHFLLHFDTNKLRAMTAYDIHIFLRDLWRLAHPRHVASDLTER